MSSTAALISLQGLGYLAPLITIPFLIHKLGIQSFGKLGLLIAFFQYFVLVVEYGFSTSAAISISRMINSNKRSGTIFWNLTFYKTILSIIILAITILAVTSIQSLQNDWKLILASYTSVLTGILLPTWLFIGKDKVVYINTISLTGKISTIPFIFLLISGPEDAWIAALIQNIIPCIAGICTLIYANKKGWIPTAKISLPIILALIKNGYHIFITNLSINFYTHSVTVILGLNAGTAAVGTFIAADRVRQALQGLIIPVSQAFFPKINNLVKKDQASAKKLIKQALLTQALYGAAISLIMLLFSDIAALMLYKESSVTISELIRLASPLPLIIALSNVLCTLTLTSFDLKNVVSRIILISGLISLASSYAMTKFFGTEGAFISILLTEFLVLSLSAFECQKRKLIQL